MTPVAEFDWSELKEIFAPTDGVNTPQAKLNQARRNLSHISILDLETLDSIRLQYKAGLNTLRSRRDVYDAVWKASPYGIPTVISASILTTSFILSNHMDARLLAIPWLVLWGVVLITLVCWIGEKGINETIGHSEVILESTEQAIRIREAEVTAALISYKDHLVRSPFRWSFSPFSKEDEDRQLTTLRSTVGDKRIKDIDTRHLTIRHWVEELEGTTSTYVAEMRTFRNELKRLIEESNLHDKDEISEAAIDELEAALLKIITGIDKTGVIKVGVLHGEEGRSAGVIQKLQTDEQRGEKFRWLLEEKALIEKGKRIDELRLKGTEQADTLISRFEYLFPRQTETYPPA